MRTPVSIDKDKAKVITSGTYSLLDTNFGLQVKFDGVHQVEITVPGEYFDKVRRSPVLLSLQPNLSCHVRQSKTKGFMICILLNVDYISNLFVLDYEH